jgi:hypothetical protein
LTKKRRAPNKDERIAACLLEIKRGDEWLIPEPLRSSGDTQAILRHVEWDHLKMDTLGGDTSPQNISPKSKPVHLAKTKSDVKALAKAKRIEKEHAAFRARILAKQTGEEAPKPKKPKKKWPKQIVPGSKASGWKKPLHGKPVRRDEKA